jgi:hypothetical protein
MTYWATLWYAGSVVVTLGYEGQTAEQCDHLGQQMMFDITSAYMDPALQEELAASVFPEDLFSFSCETVRLPVDEEYRE